MSFLVEFLLSRIGVMDIEFESILLNMYVGFYFCFLYILVGYNEILLDIWGKVSLSL